MCPQLKVHDRTERIQLIRRDKWLGAKSPRFWWGTADKASKHVTNCSRGRLLMHSLTPWILINSSIRPVHSSELLRQILQYIPCNRSQDVLLLCIHMGYCRVICFNVYLCVVYLRLFNFILRLSISIVQEIPDEFQNLYSILMHYSLAFRWFHSLNQAITCVHIFHRYGWTSKRTCNFFQCFKWQRKTKIHFMLFMIGKLIL